MENIKTITKFEINDKKLYAKVSWKPNVNNLFHIKIYDDIGSWSGEFSYETAQDYKEYFDETDDQYFDNVKKGLSKDCDFGYSFVINQTDNSAEFMWKKIVKDANLKHGCVVVHRDKITESKDLLIDELLAENENLRDCVKKANDRNKDLGLDLDKCKNCLEELKDMKTSLETTLYGKFVQILNEKKRRIELLEDNLKKLSKS